MDGIQIRNDLLKTYQKIIEENQFHIHLVIIQVGDDFSSNVYIRNKIKYTKLVGIETQLMKLEETVTEEELIQKIQELNEDSKVTGILLQSPTPSHIDFIKCARMISPSKDVDGLTEKNLFALRDHREEILPCTVKGILKLMESYSISLEGKRVVVIGRSVLVGRPLVDALINRDATVTLCHSKTINLEAITRTADILICAVGKPNFITREMVKEGVIGIDVGINTFNGKIVGDFSKEVEEKASYLTPVPGGVGPMTVAMVIDNLIQLKMKERK